jgi:hypothetical protein
MLGWKRKESDAPTLNMTISWSHIIRLAPAAPATLSLIHVTVDSDSARDTDQKKIEIRQAIEPGCSRWVRRIGECVKLRPPPHWHSEDSRAGSDGGDDDLENTPGGHLPVNKKIPRSEARVVHTKLAWVPGAVPEKKSCPTAESGGDSEVPQNFRLDSSDPHLRPSPSLEERHKI